VSRAECRAGRLAGWIVALACAGAAAPRATPLEARPGNETALLRASAWVAHALTAHEAGERRLATAALERAWELAQGATDVPIAVRLPQLVEIARTAEALRITGVELVAFQWFADAYASIPEPTDSDRFQLAKSRYYLGAALYDAGRLEEAHEHETAALAGFERAFGQQKPDDPLLLSARTNLAVTKADLGRFEEARELQESLIASRERLLASDPAQSAFLVQERCALASTLTRMGEHRAALELLERTVVEAERTIAPGSPAYLAVLEARTWLARAHYHLGELEPALGLLRDVHGEYRERLGPTHSAVLGIAVSMGATLAELDRVLEARDVVEAALAEWRAARPAGDADDLDLRYAQRVLAGFQVRLGEAHAARASLEDLVAFYERGVLPGDPRREGLRQAKELLAVACRQAGDLEAALFLGEEVVARYEQLRSESAAATLPELIARANLAATLAELGKLERARAHQRAVLEGLETLRPSNPSQDLTFLEQLEGLAAIHAASGDPDGGIALLESVLSALERSLPPTHAAVIGARAHLATMLDAQGDHVRAADLHAANVEVHARELTEGHPDLLRSRSNLAVAQIELRRYGEALELLEEVIAGYERLYLPDHPSHADLLRVYACRANALHELGRLAEASALQERILAGHERAHLADRPGHPDLLRARADQIVVALELGERDRARELLDAQLDGLAARLDEILLVSPREARAACRALDGHVSDLVFVLRELDVGEDGVRAAHAVLETRRSVATLATRAAGPDAAAQRARVASAAGRLAARLHEGQRAGESAEEWRDAAARLALERDGAERELRAALVAEGLAGVEVDPRSLAERLPDGALAVGYHRADGRVREASSGLLRRGAERLLALVVPAEGPPLVVELGPLDEVRRQVERWRSAIAGTRGGAGREREWELDVGRVLRRAVLDPVLEAGGAEPGAPLYVCTDDVLHLAPLDALPLDAAGERVGDRHPVRRDVSFARRLAPRPPGSERPALLLVGDVDFDAGAERGPSVVSASSPRGGPGPWPPLPGTAEELLAVASRFARAFAEPPAILRGAGATKPAVAAALAGRTHVHLATHGWFLASPLESLVDEPTALGSELRASVERAVVRLAPLAISGLCLAGANRSTGAGGGADGLLTGEELAQLDLGACELAVLSACETAVGVASAQAMLSLQAALHAAGARAAVTSLWLVDDEAALELMADFYANLWLERMDVSDALWEAKLSARRAGRPVAHWAGWLLTGSPD